MVAKGYGADMYHDMVISQKLAICGQQHTHIMGATVITLENNFILERIK